jgi:hypothetical protein
VQRRRTSFGKKVAEAWREAHDGQDPPKKSIFCNGQEVSANGYFECDLPIIDAVFAQLGATAASSHSQPTGPSSRGEAIRDYFRAS